MKTSIQVILAVFLTLAMTSVSQAESAKKVGHPGGEWIQESTVEKFQFSYQLIDLRGKVEGIEATHHLMVYIVDPQGQKVANSQVGFRIRDMGEPPVNLMAMAMGDGYGADINLGGQGPYMLQTKVILPNKRVLRDTFAYEVPTTR